MYSIVPTVVIFNFILLTMLFITVTDQLFKELSYSQHEHSSRVSKLNVNIPTPTQRKLGISELSNDIKKNDNSEIGMQSTDIIPYLTKSSAVNQLIMETDLKYPKGCSFCFEGYKGVEDYDRLKDFLIDSACKSDGTQLTVAIYDEIINKPNS